MRREELTLSNLLKPLAGVLSTGWIEDAVIASCVSGCTLCISPSMLNYYELPICVVQTQYAEYPQCQSTAEKENRFHQNCLFSISVIPPVSLPELGVWEACEMVIKDQNLSLVINFLNQSHQVCGPRNMHFINNLPIRRNKVNNSYQHITEWYNWFYNNFLTIYCFQDTYKKGRNCIFQKL